MRSKQVEIFAVYSVVECATLKLSRRPTENRNTRWGLDASVLPYSCSASGQVGGPD